MNRLRALWWRVAGSLWFVPALTVFAATVLAVAAVELDTRYPLELGERWLARLLEAADP